MAHDLKSIRTQFREKGVFYSDPRMAILLQSYLPKEVTEVYDPTCGDGALLAVFGDNVRKYGQELDTSQAAVASQRLTNCDIAAGDTLADPAFGNHKFKAIIANPPFSIKYDPSIISHSDLRFCNAPCLPPPSKADYLFILHIIHYLADDGVAVILNYPGILYRGQREARIRQWLIQQNYIDRVELVEGGYFADTSIPTVILVVRKNRTTRNITFADHALKIERTVPIEVIESNGFNLSVSYYVSPPQPPRQHKDPLSLENLARSAAIKRIKAEIEFSKLVAEMEGWPMDEFLDDIEKVVREARVSFIT